MSTITPESIGDTLIKDGLVTQAQWQEAVSRQKEKGGHVFKSLYELGHTDEEKLVSKLSSLGSYCPVRLWKYKPPQELLELLPRETATLRMALPLSRIGDIVTIAMVEPWNEEALNEIRGLISGMLIPVLIGAQDAEDAIQSSYGDNYETELKDVIKQMEGPSVQVMDTKEEEAGITDKSMLLSLTDQEPVVRLTNSILIDGAARKASDIFVEPAAHNLVVRYRVDGLLQDGPHPPKSMHQGVISRMKIMSNLDIAEQRLPQDGRLKIKIENRNVEFRLSTLPSYYGEKACLRILDPGSVKLNINHLGFDDANLAKIAKAASEPYGMILVCGPTGSGKTTTLYSILKKVDSVEKNIVTVEDPVEYYIDGINQVNVRPDVKLTFGEALRSILRQDPDIILIGEIRDSETLDIGVKAALTGHLVLSTLHTNSAAGAITRLLNMGIEPFLITSSVVLVASQRLVRKLCDKCKEPYEPKEEVKALFKNQTKKLTLYKAKGCEACGQNGFKGRVSVAETLPISVSIRDLIFKRVPEHEIKRAARKEGMQTLRENALDKVALGQTSIEEALRVTIQDEDGRDGA